MSSVIPKAIYALPERNVEPMSSIAEVVNREVYNEAEESISATGACSVACRLTNLTVDGTVAYTLAAPTFRGQFKTIQIISGANTPIANITVTGMRLSTQDVWTMATFVAATAPRSVTFWSANGTTWDAFSTVGTVSVA